MKIKNQSYKQGAIYSSGLSVVAKFVAFIQNVLIAYFIGANASTDIYFYLFGLTLLLGNMGQNIAISVLVPHITQLRMAGDQRQEMTYINTFVYSILLLGVVVSLLVWLFGPSFMNLISGFSAQTIEDNIVVLYLLTPITFLYIINMIYAEVLVSYKYFTFPLLINLVHNLLIVAFVWLLHNSLGVMAAVAGVSIAMVLNAGWLIVFLKRNIRWSFFTIRWSSLRETFSDKAVIVFNQLFWILVSMLPMYLLSQLHPGVVTIASYATKLTQTPMSIVNQVFSVFQIKLNELVAVRAFQEMRKLFIRLTRSMVFLTVAGAVALFLLRSFLVRLLYGYGGMDEESISLLITVFGIFIFSTPFTTLSVASSKVYFATKQVKIYTLITVICGILICIVNYFLISFQGITGYAVAFVLSEAILGIALMRGISKTVNS